MSEGGYMIFSKPADDSLLENDIDLTQNVTPSTMKELRDLKDPAVCAFTHSTDVSESSGTVYVAGGKIRGDFKGVAKPVNQNFEAYMIVRDETVYTWSPLLSQGFKTSVAETEVNKEDSQNGISFNQKLDYSCLPWKADNSLFELPSGITFVDVLDIKSNDQGGVQTPTLSCDVCDQVPSGTARDQCKASLGCK